MPKRPPKFFLGLEETNIHEFVSRCCHVGLSVEPLCRVACGNCGKTVKRPLHISRLTKQ